jgi:hypothetical protein
MRASVINTSACVIDHREDADWVRSGFGVFQQEPFYPERMANRILGMGDVLSFVEKAQDVVRVRPRLSHCISAHT